MYEDSSTPTKIPQSVKKRDNKVRTFAPKDSKIDSSLKDSKIDSLLKDLKKDSLPKYNEKLNRSKNLEREYQNITEEKNIFNLNKITNIEDNFIDTTPLEKQNPKYIEKIMKNSKFYEYELNISNQE